MVIRTLVAIVALVGLIAISRADTPVPVAHYTIQTEKVVPNLEAVHDASFWLISRDTTIPKNGPIPQDKGCGATAVAVDVLSTATHCLARNGTAKNVVNVDLTPVRILARVDDGDDNTLIRVTGRFPVHLSMSNRRIKWGDEIIIFGNPGSLVDMYRKGEIMGFAAGRRKDESAWVITDINIGQGDSGAGIVNNYGEVMGTVSEVSLSNGSDIENNTVYASAKVMAFKPYNFTREQLQAVGL